MSIIRVIKRAILIPKFDLNRQTRRALEFRKFIKRDMQRQAVIKKQGKLNENT